MTGAEIERELRRQKQERDGAKDSIGMSTALAEALVTHALGDSLGDDPQKLVDQYGQQIRALLGTNLGDRRLRELIAGGGAPRGKRVVRGWYGVWRQAVANDFEKKLSYAKVFGK